MIREEVKTILTNPVESPEAAKSMHQSESMYQSKVKSAVVKTAIRKAVKKSQPANAADDDLVLLYILCFLLPFVAVGIVTDWELKPLLISILLSLLCWIPAIIYAIVVVNRNR